jgi:hypothetical protein
LLYGYISFFIIINVVGDIIYCKINNMYLSHNIYYVTKY